MRFVIDARYVRRRPSGIGAYVEALVDRLPGLAPDQAFRLWNHPERPRAGAAPNVSHRVVKAPADGPRTVFAPGLLDRLRRDDVVHFPHSLLGWPIAAATVVTIHDLMWVEHPEWVESRAWLRRLRYPFYRHGMMIALRRATRLVAVSQATADRIVALIPATKERLVVIRHGVAPGFLPPADWPAAEAQAARLVGGDEPYFLVVGKNEPYKAHELALRAFAAGAAPQERLVLVQRTKRGRGLHRLARQLGVSHRVRWLPGLSQAELVTVYQGARALLQPSLAEGFGMPALEAMACGCPVIASDTPALAEVLGGAGQLAPMGSVPAAAAALGKLRDEGRRRELRARGLERARAFDWDEAAAATLEVYREAGSAGPRGGWW
ncbi:MAG: glycosyltransferase family 4 protein [Deltaproteobacteria bacterium]|nr:glycosyltransferase family 4 protein [Deltaproteobacteria bacterium]